MTLDRTFTEPRRPHELRELVNRVVVLVDAGTGEKLTIAIVSRVSTDKLGGLPATAKMELLVLRESIKET